MSCGTSRLCKLSVKSRLRVCLPFYYMRYLIIEYTSRGLNDMRVRAHIHGRAYGNSNLACSVVGRNLPDSYAVRWSEHLDSEPTTVVLGQIFTSEKEDVIDSVAKRPGTSTPKLSRTCFTCDIMENPPLTTTTLPVVCAASTDPQRWRLSVTLTVLSMVSPDSATFYSLILVCFLYGWCKICKILIRNTENEHQWTDVNLHATIESRYQHMFSCIVWTGMVGEIC